MNGLKGKLGNKEVRQWYKKRDSLIPEMIDKSLPLKEQAMQAFDMRNQYRTQALPLMPIWSVSSRKHVPRVVSRFCLIR